MLVDIDEDGIIDCAYAGDLLGNLWKFDFTSGEIFGAEGWIAAFYDQADPDLSNMPAPRPLISVRDKAGNPQPIMTRPTVTRPCTVSGSGLMVLFGTGWLDDEGGNNDQTQSIYGIWDWQEVWKNNFDLNVDPAISYYGDIAVVEESGAGTRKLSNLARFLSVEQAHSISLLEQTQLALSGISFYTREEAAGSGGRFRAGDLKRNCRSNAYF